jgi:hypothetical protein
VDREDTWNFLGSDGVRTTGGGKSGILDDFQTAANIVAAEPTFDRPGVEKWDGDIYRESSHIQLTSHVFPPSDEKDCSIRADLGEMLSQT